MNKWIQACRLRTLPLSLASVFVGNALAKKAGFFSPTLFVLCLITALLLQILSNLANDYGDFVNKKDTVGRIGPIRTMQAGLISKTAMQKAMATVVLLCLVFGGWLIILGTARLDFKIRAVFILLGVISIFSAIYYTVGKKPYGYSGFGDIFVFLFFGPVGVCGAYFLQTNQFDASTLLPAASIGFFVTAVININNMRDIESDRNTGKKTLATKLGLTRAKQYHVLLIASGLCCALLYTVPSTNLVDYLFMLTAPIFIKDASAIKYNTEFKRFDVFLKRQVITSCGFSVSFILGLLL